MDTVSSGYMQPPQSTSCETSLPDAWGSTGVVAPGEGSFTQREDRAALSTFHFRYSYMNPAKYLTAGPVPSATKPMRITVKDQEVAQLMERVDDLETCISVNVQLMQDIASERPQRSGEDTETGAHYPSKLYEKLLEQKRLLEAAIAQTRAQKSLCLLKISRSESDTTSSQQSEARLHTETLRQIAQSRKQLEDKEQTVQSLEATLSRLEGEFQLCQSNKVAVVDLPGTALRIARLTKKVRQDDQITQVEKMEMLEKCKVRHYTGARDTNPRGKNGVSEGVPLEKFCTGTDG